MDSQQAEITKVIEGGYCVGCGACAALSRRFGMALNKSGQYLPECMPDSVDIRAVSSVCPFSSEEQNEDEIGKELYGTNPHHHEALGYYTSTYSGHAVEGSYRDSGSSGGMGSWILAEAMNDGLIDTVLHVKSLYNALSNTPLFGYVISKTVEEIQQGGKSKYYPVTLADALAYLVDHDGKFAIVGVPCFVKAIRRFAKLRPEAGEKIKLVLGLVCGHMKSTGFAECLAWQAGVSPSSIKSVDFRHKFDHGMASRYAFRVTPNDGSPDVVRPMAELLGRDWGMSFFKLEACEYCDDVTAETADISIGDAWLPEYKNDSKGTNIIIVRNPSFVELFSKAAAENRLKLEPISADKVSQSQDAGLRHRRQGLAYRLWLKDRKSIWRPVKRIQPSHSVGVLRKVIYRLRMAMMKASVQAFERAKRENNLSLFIRGVTPLTKIYFCAYVAMRLAGIIRHRLVR